jgi:hypothetical protein
MKRFLNKVKVVSITPFVGGTNTYSKKFKLANQNDAVNNELVIGQDGNGNSYLFLVKAVTVGSTTEKQLFSLSHDDFAYDFLRIENERINNLYAQLRTIIPNNVDANEIVDRDTPE